MPETINNILCNKVIGWTMRNMDDDDKETDNNKETGDNDKETDDNDKIDRGRRQKDNTSIANLDS
jgi:hypothetical protein